MTGIHKLRSSSAKYQEIWAANQVFKHLSTIKVIPKYSASKQNTCSLFKISASNTDEKFPMKKNHAVPNHNSHNRNSHDAQAEKIRAAILPELRKGYSVDLKKIRSSFIVYRESKGHCLNCGEPNHYNYYSFKERDPSKPVEWKGNQSVSKKLSPWAEKIVLFIHECGVVAAIDLYSIPKQGTQNLVLCLKWFISLKIIVFTIYEISYTLIFTTYMS
ncbi:hypothetical protein ACTFIW_006049 [Dictyostelium discoideum]